MGDASKMSKPLVFLGLAQFVAATAGRNMTKAAYTAVVIGVGAMVLLTIDPSYETAHRSIDVVLWACVAYFAFEWVVRLRHAMTEAGLTEVRFRFDFEGTKTIVQ